MAPSTRFGLLREQDFRRLFGATALGTLSDRVIFLALPLVAIVALNVDEFQVGLLTATTMAGSLLVGLPAGAWVDRVRKRSVLINTDFARALILAAIPVAWGTGLLSIWLLYAVALVHGVLTVFFDVAYRSYLPHLVGRDNLAEGNAKLSAVRSVASISGPGVAGPLVGGLGAPLALLASSVGMIASGVLALAIGKREPQPLPAQRPHLGREVREGLTFVLGNPVLRATLLSEGLFNLFLVVYQTMLMVFLARQLGLGSLGIGLILSATSCGGLVGALVATKVADRVGIGPTTWLAPLLTVPATVLMPLSSPGWSIYPAAAGLAMMSLGGVIRSVTQASVQQALTPDRLLGRMSATSRFVTWGGLPLGGLLGGVCGSLFGAPVTLWIGAAGMFLTIVPTLISPLRTMRELPTLPEPETGPLPGGPVAGSEVSESARRVRPAVPRR